MCESAPAAVSVLVRSHKAMAGCGSAAARIAAVLSQGQANAGLLPRGEDLQPLIDLCPDTEKCKPREFDFRPHRVGNDEKEKEKKEKEEKRQKLPKRLLLSAFSEKVGHRPTGLQRR